MSRTRLPGKTRWRAAAYLVMAVLFALRCSAAWAGADLAPEPSLEAAHGGPLVPRSRVAALALVRPAPACCEASADDPPAPSAGRVVTLRWAAPATTATHAQIPVAVGALARPPPARGPPPQAI